MELTSTHDSQDNVTDCSYVKAVFRLENGLWGVDMPAVKLDSNQITDGGPFRASFSTTSADVLVPKVSNHEGGFSARVGTASMASSSLHSKVRHRYLLASRIGHGGSTEN